MPVKSINFRMNDSDKIKNDRVDKSQIVLTVRKMKMIENSCDSS